MAEFKQYKPIYLTVVDGEGKKYFLKGILFDGISAESKREAMTFVSHDRTEAWKEFKKDEK
jgi:hypothetical protein